MGPPAGWQGVDRVGSGGNLYVHVKQMLRNQHSRSGN